MTAVLLAHHGVLLSLADVNETALAKVAEEASFARRRFTSDAADLMAHIPPQARFGVNYGRKYQHVVFFFRTWGKM